MSRLPNLTLRVLGGCHSAASPAMERLKKKLVRYLAGRDWRVVVYAAGHGPDEVTLSERDGVEYVTIAIPEECSGAKAAKLFEQRAVRHASQFHELCLTFGSPTAMDAIWLRLKGVPNLIKLDGIHMARAGRSTRSKLRSWFNDWLVSLVGKHLIADHPEVARRVQQRVSAGKVSMIGNGADRIRDPDVALLAPLGLERDRYVTLMVDGQDDDSLVQMVRAFSTRQRDIRLVAIGAGPDHSDACMTELKSVAGAEVTFLGDVKDRPTLEALLVYGLASLHGHQINETLESPLVAAMSAGSAIIAHENPYNRWVSGDAARYFQAGDDLRGVLDQVLVRPEMITRMREASARHFESHWQWKRVLGEYENLLQRWLPTPWEVKTPAIGLSSQRDSVESER